MKKLFYSCVLLIAILGSCRSDDDPVFDKSADQRVAEAITELKSALTRPQFGWKVKYQPEEASGSYWVLLKFENNNQVTIKTDLPQADRRYFEQTITYRIDSSLGLELIFESYSFFSFLFEQDQATFLAEYEFNYANTTPDNSLVFVSKTDPGTRTRLVFEEAGEADEALLAQRISTGLQRFPASCRLSYTARNLAVYLSLDNLRRTASFNYVSLKTNQQNGQNVDLLTGFYLRGDSIVFERPLDVTFNGQRVYLKSILLNEFREVPENICPEPSTGPLFEGLTSLNEPVELETSLFDNRGAAFRTASSIYIAPVDFLYDETGFSMGERIRSEIEGAVYFVVYNNNNGFDAMGFLIENPDGTTAIVVKEFTVTVTGNALELAFANDFTVFRTLHPRTNIQNINTYLNYLTAGGKAYSYRVNQFYFQLYNPCSEVQYFVQILQ